MLSILMFNRSRMWWNRVVLQTFSESDWIVNFRVSKDSFNFICSKLEPVIKRMDTRLWRAISVEGNQCGASCCNNSLVPWNAM